MDAGDEVAAIVVERCFFLDNHFVEYLRKHPIHLLQLISTNILLRAFITLVQLKRLFIMLADGFARFGLFLQGHVVAISVTEPVFVVFGRFILFLLGDFAAGFDILEQCDGWSFFNFRPLVLREVFLGQMFYGFLFDCLGQLPIARRRPLLPTPLSEPVT